MTIVIDLDAAWNARQREGLGQGNKQFMLRGGVGKLARQGFARIGQCVVHQFLALAASRHRNFYLALALGGERLRQQVTLLEVMRHKDAARRRLVVVELREKSAKHFVGPDRTVCFRKIGTIAPVLPGAEKENLDARETAGLMHGKYVGLL